METATSKLMEFLVAPSPLSNWQEILALAIPIICMVVFEWLWIGERQKRKARKKNNGVS